jgi:ABC-type polysaccharide/polyol phosphate transport system ATPase subunit
MGVQANPEPGKSPSHELEPGHIAISVNNVSKAYKVYSSPGERLKEILHPRKKYHKEFWALKDVSIQVPKGSSVGIVGQNGSGKSTLLQVICGLLRPTSGSVRVNGRISALLELGAGFNRDFTGRENVFMNGAIMGISRKEMEERFERIADFAEIGHFIDQPVKTYSSGMYVRLAFATAINIDPEILIVDEALSVGDVRFQARCFDKIEKMRDAGATVLFVTHAMPTFQSVCQYGYLLDNGTLFAEGDPKEVSLVYHKLQRDREHEYQERLKKKSAAPVAPTQPSKTASAKANTLQGEFRFGLQTAKIVDFKVLNHEGNETTMLETGKKFRVWMRIEFYGHVKNPAVGVMVRNPQGQNLLGIHSYHEKRMDLGEKNSGDVLNLTLESEMLLNPGKYILNIGIADHETDYEYKSIDVRNNICSIGVYGKSFVYGLIHNPGEVKLENS